MPRWSRAALAVAFCALAGCGFGESGVEPPVDRVFLPAGLAADPGGRWLYAVNSNSDLRFNAGTVTALDVERAATDRARTDWPRCPSSVYVPSGPTPGGCCWDYFDGRVLNCDDRGYVSSAVRIGSFGGNAVLEPRSDLPGVASRLYVSVRSEPSVTFIDLAPSAEGPGLRCDARGGANALCDDAHKIRGDINNTALSALRLLEEPHALAIDRKLNLLYVGHLIEGLSVIDTCGEKPELLAVNRRLFAQAGQGVTSVLLPEEGNLRTGVLVTSRNFSGNAGEVQTLALQGFAGGCGDQNRKNLELVPSEGFFSSALFPNGSDIRDLVVAPGTNRTYLLHRNALGRQNVPVVVEVDRSPDANGVPLNRAGALVETCAGATELHLHDAGRGPRLYVVCFEAGQIYVLEPAPLSVVGIINIGRGPNTLVFSPRDPGIAYVAGFSDNNISVIDLAPSSPTENRVIQRIGFPQLRK